MTEIDPTYFDDMVPQNEAAAFLHISPRTLERYRQEGGGPEYVKLGKRVLYARTALRKYAASRLRTSTTAAA